MELKVYGISYGETTEIKAVQIAPFIYVPIAAEKTPFLPSMEFIRALENTPPDKKIGIPALQETYLNGNIIENINLGGIEITLPSGMQVYLSEILTVAHNKKIEPVFLYNPDIIREHIMMSAELQKLKKIRRKSRGGVYRRASRKIQEVEAEINYLETTQIVNTIYDFVKKGDMGAVILPLEYAECIFSRKEELSKEGIDITYCREERHMNEATLAKRDIPDKKIIGSAEAARRKYNAIKFGRILPEKNPQFIGRYSLNGTTNLFEIYFGGKEGSMINGWLQDELGTASVVCQIKDGEIVLNAQYTEEAISIGANPMPFEFRGDSLPLQTGYAGEVNTGLSIGNFALIRYGLYNVANKAAMTLGKENIDSEARQIVSFISDTLRL